MVMLSRYSHKITSTKKRPNFVLFIFPREKIFIYLFVCLFRISDKLNLLHFQAIVNQLLVRESLYGSHKCIPVFLQDAYI